MANRTASPLPVNPPSGSKTAQFGPDLGKQRSSNSLLDFIQVAGKVAGATFVSIVMVSGSLITGGLVGLAGSFRNLPDVRVLQSYVPSETSYIYDIKGRLLATVHDEANRKVVPLDQISPNLKRSVLAIEDSHFYQHVGINPNSVIRALVANMQTGSVVEGGSTLTMQLVKNLFLTPQRSMSRKAAEAILALRIEQVLEKDRILELYLNQVYWGHNTYGAETAAQSYFGKSVKDLNLAEAAMMAGFIQAPEDYSPFDSNYKFDPARLENARWRQHVVLDRLAELGWITPEEAETAKTTPIKFGKITSFSGSKVPYVTDAVLQELNDRYGQDRVKTGGMRVQTTVDYNLQAMAQKLIQDWSGQMRQSVGADQMALVAVDPRTHFIKAMVGGVNYQANQFNRAIAAQRQPGSAFKPFVYYTALATRKYTPSTSISDSPVSYPDGDEYYSPRNYDGSFMGSMSLKTALELSRNIPAIRLGQEVGLNRVIEICHLIGIESDLEPVISLPLGAVGITPLEMAGAYATFASGGWYSETTLIAQITDSQGNLILDNTPEPRQVLDAQATAYLNQMLQGVIEGGTGTAARLDRPAAGKTGTTSSARDIWFVGYVPQLATAVWVGNDDNTPLWSGATGGGIVAPVWKEFMLKALKGVPVEKFVPPTAN